MYPIADNDSPRLSADRLEYTLKNIVRYQKRELSDIKEYYDDIVVVKNEDDEDELAFSTVKVAEQFCMDALKTCMIYSADADRYIMERLANVIRVAMEKEVISEEDLYSTEDVVLNKLVADEQL